MWRASTWGALRRSPIGAAMRAGLVCGMQPGSAQAEPLGARQRLAAATAAAQAWQKDAQLVRVETRNADAQGRSPDWTYVFDSPGAKKQTLVSVFGSDKPDLMPTGTAYRRPLGDFVDSTVAMPVSYTHLTLPTSDLVEISVGAVSLKKKKNKRTVRGVA